MKIVILSLSSCFSFTVHLRILRSLGNIFTQTSEPRFPRCRYLGKGVAVFLRCPWPTRGCHEVCRLIFDKCRFLVAVYRSFLSRQTFASAASNYLLAFHPEYNARLVRICVRVCTIRWSTENLFTIHKFALDVVVVARHSPSAFHTAKHNRGNTSSKTSIVFVGFTTTFPSWISQTFGRSS